MESGIGDLQLFNHSTVAPPFPISSLTTVREPYDDEAIRRNHARMLSFGRNEWRRMTMGTWDTGLYDNDRALDELGDLFDGFDMNENAGALATIVGLRAWLDPPLPAAMVESVRQHAEWVATLPTAVRELLDLLVRDRESFGAPRARSAELTAVLGSHCDGPKYEPLLALSGSAAVIAELAKRATERLQDGLEAARDLYEAADATAPLGVLLELSAAGYWSPTRDAVVRWRRAIDRADAETNEERKFWDEYVSRLRRGLALLEPNPRVIQAE